MRREYSPSGAHCATDAAEARTGDGDGAARDRDHPDAAVGQLPQRPNLRRRPRRDAPLLQRARRGAARPGLRRGRRDADGRVVHHLPPYRRRRPAAGTGCPASRRGPQTAPARAARPVDRRTGRRAAEDRRRRLPAHRTGEPPARRRRGALGRQRSMRISLWGTRGSLPSAGPETVRYGGNTSCVELRDAAGALVVLDAGTGIRRLDILLTHLHMDHIQGFGFFEPLFRPELEVHVWGPPSTTHDLRTRLTKYLSPPLFPVRLRDLPCRLHLHDVPMGSFMIASLEVHAALVFHPGPTVGYRFVERGHSLVYIPDHEPALGARDFPASPRA